MNELIISTSGVRGIPDVSLKENDILVLLDIYLDILKNLHPISERPTIVTGRDGRPSGEKMLNLVNSYFLEKGFNVLSLNITTTPTLQIYVKEREAYGGVMITASHNPPQWNGLKFFNTNGEILAPELMKTIQEKFQTHKVSFYKHCTEIPKIQLQTEDAIHTHLKKILSLPLLPKNFSYLGDKPVAIDVINSGGLIILPILLGELGLKNYTLINADLGKFKRFPEPIPDNLQILSQKVKGKFFLTIVVDPDVDRVVFLDENGSPFGEEYTLVAVADFILSYFDKMNTKVVVTNFSTTYAIEEICAKHGADIFRAPVGESNIIRLMKEKMAVIGGEGSGGVIFPQVHYCRDAITTIALFLSILEKERISPSFLRQRYPNYKIKKSKIAVSNFSTILEIEKSIVQEVLNFALNNNAEVNLQDGVYIKMPGWWLHIRKSNTEPVLRIIYEIINEDNYASLEELLTKLNIPSLS